MANRIILLFGFLFVTTHATGQNMGTQALTPTATPEKIIHKSFIIFKADLKWGKGGSEKGMFKDPNALCLDPSGNIYVIDKGNDRIQKFDSEGKFIDTASAFEKWDTNGDFHASNLNYIAVDKEGNFFFQNDGLYLGYTSLGKLIFMHDNTHEEGGYFINQNGYLYSASSNNDGSFQKRSRGGKLVVEYPDKAANAKGLVVDSKSNIYIINTSYGNTWGIQKYGPDGKFLTQWGKQGTNDSEFQDLNALAIDAEDHLYICDSGMNRVKVFTTDGKLWNQFGHDGIGFGELRKPGDIAINSKGQVYVLDQGNFRVQRFTRYRVEETVTESGKILLKKETPLTTTLLNSALAYDPKSNEPEDKNERADSSKNLSGDNSASDQKKEDLGKAAGDAAKNLLGF